MITSRNNSKLKLVRKLLSNSKERKETGLFVVEGQRICREIPENLLKELFVSEEYYNSLKECCDYVAGQVEIVDNNIFRDISDTVNPQGVLAVVKMPEWKDTGIRPGHGKRLILDGVRDPGNLGTIIRTAEAAGVSAVYLSPDCVDLYNPKVIRSTMGSIFRVPVFSCELVPVIERMKEEGIPVYGTSLSARRSYKEADLSNAAIIIGSEANGASQEVLEAAGECVIIPMKGEVESLNAAVSAAVLMFG